jgi:hypothetical protein
VWSTRGIHCSGGSLLYAVSSRARVRLSFVVIFRKMIDATVFGFRRGCSTELAARGFVRELCQRFPSRLC